MALKGARSINGKALATLNGNGSIQSTLNGHAVGSTRTRQRRRGFLTRSFSTASRLFVWYAIITILFRCPATLDGCDESTARICKPYFHVKHTVAPHVEPYYERYAARYVELVRPYYDSLDGRVIAPTRGFLHKHGAPWAQHAQAAGKARWNKTLRPQLVKYQTMARTRYDESLAPHVQRFSSALGPYYEIARTNALQSYHDVLLPSYRYTRPYVQKSYRAASSFSTGIAVPAMVWARDRTYSLLDETVWPRLRTLYQDKVEPQLEKITARLGRYHGHARSQKTAPASQVPLSHVASSVAEPAAASLVASSPGSTTSSALAPSWTDASEASEATEQPVATVSNRLRSSNEPIGPPEVDEDYEKQNPVRREARLVVAQDLKDWQERYAKAADEGAAEIESRIEEITRDMIQKNAMTVGRAHVDQLQAVAASELASLRRDMLSIVGARKKGVVTADVAEDQIRSLVRRAGLTIKEKAQAVRSWREEYEAETQEALTRTALSHFQMLDSIRDLAIQKIGMKWAWMDGITYKDWAKYHELKTRFDEWQGHLEQLIVTHPSLLVAQLEGQKIEDEAMKSAATAARELVRLKDVARWKLAASDDSDEFDSSLMKQAAEAAEAAEAALLAVKDGVEDGVEDTVEGAREGADKVVEVAKAAEVAADVSPLARVSEAARRVTDAVTDSVDGVTRAAGDAVGSAAEGVASPSEQGEQATASWDEAPTMVASSAVLEETPVLVGNTSELVEEDGPVPVELPVKELSPVDSTADEEEDGEDGPESHQSVSESHAPEKQATEGIRPALFGAAAQSVPSRQPILDGDGLDDWARTLESMRESLPKSVTSAAQAAYSAALSHANEQYAHALSAMSVRISGTPKPAHEQMLASATSAYSNAMAAVTGRLDVALHAVHEKVAGTPTTEDTFKLLPTALPTSLDWARVESVAAERLNNGRAWAEEQYESARVAVGLATPTPTPTTPSDHVSKLLDNARHNYFAGLGVAYARYDDFMRSASAAVSSMTATPTPTDMAGTVSSVASVAGDSLSQAGDSVALAWDAMVDHISSRVYGAPTPTAWYESLYSAAGDYAGSASEAVGDGVAGAQGHVASQIAAAREQAASNYAAVSSIVSELVNGKEQSYQESVYSRLSAAYVTGASSASSVASDAADAAKHAGDKVASAASQATDAVKGALGHDEL